MQGRGVRWLAALAMLVSGCGLVFDPSFPRDVPAPIDRPGDQEVADALDAPDVDDALDAPDLGDVSDAPDAGDVSDIPDAGDASDAADARDAPDAPDVPDVPDAPDVLVALDVPDVLVALDVPVPIDVPDVPQVLDVPLPRDVPDVPDVPGCEGSLTRCGAECVNLGNNTSHCGACGRTCPSLLNAITACGGGMCALVGCMGAFANCDRDPRNGCEILVTTDPRHCGMCGRECPAGASCVNSRCECPPGRMACGPACVDLVNDRNHCGACGNACPSSERCVAGRCTGQCTINNETTLLPRCNTGLSCLVGLRCVLNGGACVPDECVNDLICRPGTLCRRDTVTLTCNGGMTTMLVVNRCRQ